VPPPRFLAAAPRHADSAAAAARTQLLAPQRSFDKVFCIGANKTGTSTMEAVFRDLGLRTAPQEEGERAGVQFHRGQFEPLRDYIRAHDAFQDAPFSIKTTYAQVDALFPGSRFILTYRPADDWFRSLVSYHAKVMGECDERGRPTAEAVRRLDYIQPGYVANLAETNWLADVTDELEVRKDWSLLYDEAHYKALYMRRNRDIVRHFIERPRDLLVIDVTRESDTRRIVDFLGLPAHLVRPMPHMNRT